MGSALRDGTTPHAQPPHRFAGSVASLLYHWFDFVLGTWVVFMPFKVRSGLIVLERGYWDIAVDQRRYRLAAPEAFVRLLGWLLPRPDLVILLEATAEILAARKTEITAGEVQRQVHAWRRVLPAGTRVAHVDAAGPPEAVEAAAREAVFSVLSRRAVRGLGPGWIGVPSRSSPRWTLPRGTRRSAVSALSIYQPVTARGRLGWELGRAAAASGLLRAWPRGEAPETHVMAAVAPYLVPGATFAVQRANHPGRHQAMLIGSDGRPYALAKVASDESEIRALELEAANIARFGRMLEAPLRPPTILDHVPGLLLLESIAWSPRNRPWLLPSDVAQALGRAYARSLNDRGEDGMAHGDCAPWNLLKTRGGWVLVDWEAAIAGAPPFFDLFHFLVQSHALLGRPSLRELTEPGLQRTWMREAIHAYAVGAGLTDVEWRMHFSEYLHMSSAGLDPSVLKESRALAARQRLLARLARQP
jgi:hypothetical protein